MRSHRRYHYSSYDRRSVGHERALEHIRQAKKLTEELGGTDQDVKKYFFALQYRQLKVILDKYERRYGSSAREYAEQTMPRWRSGEVHMSGMVAERLFNLLPPTMPIEAKYKLTESLWKHVEPSSTKSYYIGVDADLDEISRNVRQHLEKVVIQYKIPKSMESRFDWLSRGDVEVKQKLLNHFRQQERLLLTEALHAQLPILINHLNGEMGSLTSHAAQTLKVGKHEVRIIITEGVSGISATAPRQPKQDVRYSWVWWLVGVVAVLWLLNA